MTTKNSKTHVCRCTQCGNGCASRKTAEKPPEGFLAKRPWIWIVVGYLTMVGALSTMVVIAITHQQAEVPLVHGR